MNNQSENAYMRQFTIENIINNNLAYGLTVKNVYTSKDMMKAIMYNDCVIAHVQGENLTVYYLKNVPITIYYYMLPETIEVLKIKNSDNQLLIGDYSDFPAKFYVFSYNEPFQTFIYSEQEKRIIYNEH